ncbi:MAG: hypothetical protein FWF30_03615, partial [Coriobacteriia bacterium]|nr:hypothetical protein [Coriobacteriia bacterium]
MPESGMTFITSFMSRVTGLGGWRTIGHMERIVDKVLILALSAFLALLVPFSNWLIAALLVAVSISALFEVDAWPPPLRAALVFIYLGLSLFLPGFLVFL